MKKLINILSTISVIALTSLSTISCKENNNNNFTLKQEETYIVKALVQNQPNNLLKNTFNKLTINDILLPLNYSINYNDKTNTLNYKNIEIKQDANTFLNNNYQYRIPNICGSFNLWNNIITNNNYQINYNKGNYQNYINNTANILTGSTNDFTLIMNGSTYTSFESKVFSSITNTELNNYLIQKNIFNSNIILQKSDWQKILMNISISIANNYAVCIHVIKQNTNFKIAYTNLTKQDEYNMPLPQEKPWLPLFAFWSNAITDGSVLSEDNKFITLNQDILKELKDIYNDKTSYHQINWNISTIEKLLQDNKYCNTNLDYQIIASCIYNNWNIELVNNLLVSNHNYFTLQYNQNNNYIKNNWNI